jgi:hypothetical protein
MRVTILSVLILSLLLTAVRAERVAMQLEWGFGPTPSEMYWDGQVRVVDGRLISMQAVSFEPDMHDRMTPPRFRSYTVNNGTDGMELVVDGGDGTTVQLESRQGTFQWRIEELQQKLEMSFPGKDQGRLVVRLLQRLGDVPTLLSDRSTQDSEPVTCRLADGRQLVLWRAFLGLPTNQPPRGGGDQIRGLLLDRRGNRGDVFDVLPDSGDIEVIALAPSNKGSARIVWAEQREGNWDLYTCTATTSTDGAECSARVRLTDDPGVDKTPAVAVAPDGSMALVWQGWRGGVSNISYVRWQNDEWQEPVSLSNEGTNDWNPAIATATDGSVAVAWSSWQNGSYDVCLRVWDGDGWGPVQLVASSERFQAHPSLIYDHQGTLWIAYEEGRAGWGMDSYTAGLRSVRNVRLCCYRGLRVEVPQGTAALNLPETLRDRSEMAHLAVDGNGVVWLFFRSLGQRGVWEIYGTSLGDDGWIAPQKLRQSHGGQHVRMAAAPDGDGRLRAVWTSDHRVDQVGRDSHVYTSLMPARDRRTHSLESAPAPAAAASEVAVNTRDRPTYVLDDKELGLYFGDLHRHTELSVCRTGVDGSLEDAYRYAIDAAELDFLCVTDHVQHVKILNDYDFWRTGKTADLHRVARLHQPFYGYERSQRFPYGHRNIIGLRRDVKRVPRTADNRPWSANQGYEGEKRLPPPELWTRLVGQNVITIPHTSTSPVMGTDFGYPPTAIEPVVEIYQGCRYTAEHANAPDPRQARDNDPYGGKTQPAGYIWNALSKGYRYGFIASSDHVATHNSYTCVWADEFSNEAILRALAERQCYAATDKIQCRMHMGPHLMGSEFAAEDPPPLEVDVVGTTDVDRVEVVKDNRIVYIAQPEQPTRRVSFRFQDMQVEPGVHYYYARVIQEDRNMAWISPIWVNISQ